MAFIDQCQKPSLQQYLRQQPEIAPVDYSALYSEYYYKNNNAIFGLLHGLLVYEPHRRYTASDALSHPYLSTLNK